MSSEDDIFLKTFNQMIETLQSIQKSIDLMKKTAEMIQQSINGLSNRLSNINSHLIELNNKFDNFLQKPISTFTPPRESQPASKQKEVEVSSKAKKAEASQMKEAYKAATPWTQSTGAQHPIFIDLIKKINEVSNYKEVGDILLEALSKIEANFSFSRIFYEIRRIGNSLIRKGDTEITTNDKMDLIESILEWEKRVLE